MALCGGVGGVTREEELAAHVGGPSVHPPREGRGERGSGVECEVGWGGEDGVVAGEGGKGEQSVGHRERKEECARGRQGGGRYVKEEGGVLNDCRERERVWCGGGVTDWPLKRG